MRITIMLLLIISLISTPLYSSDIEAVLEIAIKSIEKNIIEHDSKKYLRAGENQFAGFWTRDFCYSVPGLLKINKSEIVRDHLNKLLNFARKSDGLIPRVLETKDTWKRVMMSTPINFKGEKDHQYHGELKAEYVGEHGTIAIDSNLLVLIMSKKYYQHTQDYNWYQNNLSTLKKVFSFYKKHIKNGFIQQEKYGDWQDSVAREGATFLTNLFYFQVLNLYKREFNIPENYITILKRRMKKAFFSKKYRLYKTHQDLEHITLEGNLFAIEAEGFLNEAEKETIYKNLKNSPLWKNKLPGVPTYPTYPGDWISLTTKIVGLKNYHDKLQWSWIWGLSYKIAKYMKDDIESKRILSQFELIFKRDGYIYEVYNNNKNLTIFENFLYKSEGPFSWGSAKIIEGLLTY